MSDTGEWSKDQVDVLKEAHRILNEHFEYHVILVSGRDTKGNTMATMRTTEDWVSALGLIRYADARIKSDLDLYHHDQDKE